MVKERLDNQWHIPWRKDIRNGETNGSQHKSGSGAVFAVNEDCKPSAILSLGGRKAACQRVKMDEGEGKAVLEGVQESGEIERWRLGKKEEEKDPLLSYDADYNKFSLVIPKGPAKSHNAVSFINRPSEFNFTYLDLVSSFRYPLRFRREMEDSFPQGRRLVTADELIVVENGVQEIPEKMSRHPPCGSWNILGKRRLSALIQQVSSCSIYETYTIPVMVKERLDNPWYILGRKDISNGEINRSQHKSGSGAVFAVDGDCIPSAIFSLGSRKAACQRVKMDEGEGKGVLEAVQEIGKVKRGRLDKQEAFLDVVNGEHG
nr:hypothetical protein Iba_chr01aCG15550 [Ipomoea batatas]